MEYITILGSCRQESINKYYPISKIQNQLNYPHYTKEILQEIKYLKNKNINYDKTKYCFRDGLLSKCKIGINDNKYKMLKNEFNKTTLFLIEIASRISYKYDSLYLHHIAEEEQYNFNNRNQIIKKDLTDEEIEDDIIQIRKELYPKKMIIMSHFASYNYGKRYELIQLLKKICDKMDIPFIDQSEVFDKCGIENTTLNEPVLAHYNDLGKYIIAEIIKNKIEEINKKYNKI